MLSYFKHIDFLGETFKFSIKNESSFKTVFGGILSFLIFLSYIFFFYLFGKDFILKKNPNSYSEIRYPKNSSDIPSLDINETKFYFGIIAFNQQTRKTINFSEVFYPEMFIMNSSLLDNNDENLNQNNIPSNIDFIPCNFLDTSKISKMEEFKDFLCPNMSRFKGESLKRDSNFINYSYLTLRLNICKLDDELKNCDLSNILQEFQKGNILIGIISPKINYDTDNYENPFIMNIKYDYTNLDMRMNNIDNLYLIQHLLEDDIGILYENKYETKNYGIHSIDTKSFSRKDRLSKDYFNKTDEYFSPNLENPIYTINLFFADGTYYFTRKYMKLQDLLANVRGFMEILMFIFSFLYKFYNKFRLDTYFFNRLILIKENESFEKKDFLLHFMENNLKDKIKKNESDNEITNKKDKFNHLFELDMSNQKKKDKIQMINCLEKSIDEKKMNQIEENIDYNDQEKKKKIFDLTFSRFTAYKNLITFKLFEMLKNIIFSSKKSNQQFNSYDFLKVFCDKIYIKFDVFYYLKMIKRNKVLRKSILSDDQDLILKILSKKSYNLESLIEKEKFSSGKNLIEEKLWKYFISEEKFDNIKNIDINLKNNFN